MSLARRLPILPILICIVYIIVATLYSVLIPLYEPQDEAYHYAFAQHVAATGQLPVQDPSLKQPWNQEGSQAPLYYVLASVIVRLVPGADAPYELSNNPHAVVGVPDSRVNHNIFAHTAAELFPWQGPILAMHLIRLMGVLCGTITLSFIYLSARLAVPNVPLIAPLAMAFTAFNIMFLMQTTCINNDALVTMLGAISTWLILLIWRRGFHWQWIWALAIALALTGLSKASGLTAGIVAGVLLLIMAWKRCITFRQMILSVGVLGGIFAVLAGWWYVRNIQLYGDLTGLRVLSKIVGFRSEPFTINGLLKEADLLRVSFWGFYGWENIFVGPVWLPQVMDILTGIAVLGGIGWLIRAIREKRFDLLVPFGLLALDFLIMALLIINYTWQIPASVGRLLLPVMASVSILSVYAWYAAAKTIRLAWLAVLPVAVLSVVGILSPFLSVAPAYTMPAVVAALPDSATALDVRFEKITIRGYSIPKTPVLPGEMLPVTLYYSGDPDERNLSLSLEVLGRDEQLIGKIDSYPGGGMLPTSMWTPDTIYADTYNIPITANAKGPAQVKVKIGWRDFATHQEISTVQSDGTPITALIVRGSALLSNEAAPMPDQAQKTVFSGAIRLNGYSLTPANASISQDGQIEVGLVWEAVTPIYEDFNVFVHLQTEDGKLIAQADSAPLAGQYPTSAWVVNKPFTDPHLLMLNAANVSPGTYKLVVGLYRLSDGTRLPVTEGASGGDSVMLQTPVTVSGN